MNSFGFALQFSKNHAVKAWLCCLFLPSLLLLQSCEDQIIGPPLVGPLGDERVAVLCEGNFMWGNAKLAMFKFTDFAPKFLMFFTFID